MGDSSRSFLSKSRTARVKPSSRDHGKRPRKLQSRRVRPSVEHVWPTPKPGVGVLPYVVNAALPALIQGQQPFTESPTEVKTSLASSIVWMGEDYANLFAQGALYNLSCRWFVNTDLSSIRQSKCIVVSCADVTPKVLTFVNFACEHGIPSIWFHRHLPPDVCFWNFTKCVHIEDSNLFWSDICQLIA